VKGFLLDTNVVSELIKPRPEPKVTRWVEAVDESLLFLSVLTLGEIRKGIAALPRTSRRAELDQWLDAELRPRFAERILPIDEAVADRWGRVAGELAARGKPPVPVIDGLLAATAAQYDLTLVTRKSRDVARTGVSVFNPWEA
jgi:predicted nucleic acid-binding protein